MFITKDRNFKDENISTLPSGINNISIDNENNFNLKKEDINNIKPMLSSNSNSITIPDGKKIKIKQKPLLSNKKISNTFSAMANPKKNIRNTTDSNEETSSNESYDSDEILSNQSKSNYVNNQYSKSDEENSDEDDYTSVDSSINRKNKYLKKTTDEVSEYTNEYTDEDEEDEDEPEKQKTYEEIQQEKQQLLFNLERLQKQGYPPSKKYSMASSYEDMKYEHDRLKKQRDVEKSIRMSRKFLMAFVSGVEFLNSKFDYFDIKLEGWSENVMENVSDYDEVFEELHDKYSDSVKMAPELKLIAMVAGSGAMFHITNSIFKSATPKLSDILKNNPDIMKNISEAAMNNMKNNVSQQFGSNDPLGNMMKSGMDMKMNQQNKNSQPKMNGPVGIDDLLNELNDNSSVASSDESIHMKTSAKRTIKPGKRGGVTLNL